MKRTPLILLAVFLGAAFAAELQAVDFKKNPSAASPAAPGDLAVTVELVGERGTVYGPGKNIGVSFSASRDAYVVVYNVDSEGFVHLLFPADGRPVRVDGRTTYFLPEPGSGTYWETGGKTGVEYIHALAVDERSRLDEDELYFLSRSERLSEEKHLRVDLDPFLAFNMIDEEIVREANRTPPATDYTYFYINRRVDYPRYLCAKCHSPETIADPYAMECPETAIERIAYADEPRYPYPPLYDIVARGEYDEEDLYGSADDGERADDAYDRDDTRIYLSLSYGSWDYPWYSPWPYYGGSFIGWGLYPAWDPFWGSFYWNIWWNNYYWWPYYSPWYQAYPYAYNYYLPCWPCDYYSYTRYPVSFRTLSGDRSATKLRIDYATTYTALSRDRSLADSRLMKTKERAIRDKLERSDLRRRAIDSNVRKTTIRSRADGTRGVIRGSNDRNRPAVRADEPRAGTRSRESDRATDRRTTRSKRGDERRDAPDRSGARSGQPERRSRQTERLAPPPARPAEPDRRSGANTRERIDSSAEKRRASAGEASRGDNRRETSAAPARVHSTPARSAERSSSTPYRGASSGTRSNSDKTRKR